MRCRTCITHREHADSFSFDVAAHAYLAKTCPAVNRNGNIRICTTCHAPYPARTAFLIWVLRQLVPHKDVIRIIVDKVQPCCLCPEPLCKHFTCFQCEPYPVHPDIIYGYVTVMPPKQYCLFCWFGHHMCRSCNLAIPDDVVQHQCAKCDTVVCRKCTLIVWCQSNNCICRRCAGDTLTCNVCYRDVDPAKSTGSCFSDGTFIEDAGMTRCCGCEIYDPAVDLHDEERCMKTGCMGEIVRKETTKRQKK